ncbi:MAG: 3,4-dihydroxy-2-butanone-4-phosphate synthase [Sphingobacterium sp.]|jgi:3,4-dihydroxy 2-butanone 4-phosphate synthase|uniref:3,4-dihydroxy-2-butanone-4-phosphate synthase n=1 Tax=unclassified Sphingobacterium TaxID=2609468 RepID=UPI002844DC4A|nr:3,4-dihydroxy-2-butanone-4-phosphate synthase [Sphingobacterium sp.]MDR3008176.1 3,4-dihydroxy-2-butanone-4-phosphate synthase [Sphingobacterium sp.]
MKNTLELFGANAKERVENAIKELRLGKGMLLIDDEDRENEGDLIFSAEKMDVQNMVQMIRHCSGVVCLCLTHEKADELELPYMVNDNSSPFHTPFTISIDAKKGSTTGLSASDRIAAIKAACADDAQPGDLVRPGHIFPLRANDNGVLGRNGHTEGSIDLMKLAGLKPMSVLCELMNDDGTMSRLPEIIEFAGKNDLMVLSIEDIIEYRKYHTEETLLLNEILL